MVSQGHVLFYNKTIQHVTAKYKLKLTLNAPQSHTSKQHNKHSENPKLIVFHRYIIMHAKPVTGKDRAGSRDGHYNLQISRL